MCLKKDVNMSVDAQDLVVLSTQRSGSTMVCDDLAGTNMLGYPSEYFIKVIDSFFEAGDDGLGALIKDAYDRGLSKNRISSVKIMSNQIALIGEVLLKAHFVNEEGPDLAFARYFKKAMFVRVFRDDKVAQAISRVMARKTDVYHIADNIIGLKGMISKVAKVRDESGVEYKASEISVEVGRIEKEERYLDAFVKKLGVKTFDVCYEAAQTDRSYVFEIASLLGVGAVCLADRHLKKIGGSQSRQWKDRYSREVL